MNPKKMTNDVLFEQAKWETTNSIPDCPIDHTTFETPCYDELLRRLNEADALRKENEELRKDAERYRFIEANGDVISINGSAWCGDTGLSREEIDEVMQYEADFHAARLAKESEDSHVR